jgi:hypothetical protein
VKPGDHVIRLVEPARVTRRRMRDKTEIEWAVEFRMADGHTLFVGLKGGGDVLRLHAMLGSIINSKQAPEPETEPWDPEKFL